MKRLKIILQSNLFFFLLISITVGIAFVKLRTPPTLYYLEQETELVGKIEKIITTKEKITITIQAKEKLQGTYYIKKQISPTLKIGDKIKVQGKIATPSSPTTKNQFNYAFYLKKQKIYHIITISKIKVLNSSNHILDKLKNKLTTMITNPYIEAFLLGKDQNIKEEVKISYQENGISHLLAISGMHFHLLSNVLQKILKKLRIPTKKRYIIAFAALYFYSLLLETTASITRSFLFFILFSSNQVWQLNLPKTKLVITTILISLAINPYYLTEVSFWYSFIISIGLLYFIKRKKSYLQSLLTTSILAFLLSIPISLYYFYQINLLSILYNLFYIPYVSIIIFPLTILTFIFPILEPLYQITIYILEKSSLFLSQVKIATIIFPKVTILVYLLELFLLMLFIKTRNKKLFFLILLLFLGHYTSTYLKEDRIKIIDVGQGDSILLFSKGQAALIDTGGKIQYQTEPSNTITKYTTIPLLKSLGLKKLNYVFLTHGDMDHMGEIFYLINHFSVEKIYINLGPKSTLEKQLNRLVKTKISKQNNMYKVGSFTLQQLNRAYQEENTSSSVYYVQHPNLTMLLMADATKETENYLLKTYTIKTDVLKVGHHGSKTSTSDYFLKKIKPSLAIISVGNANRFHHPNQEVLETLKNNNIPVRMTKSSGTITIYPKTQTIEEDKKET